MISALIALIDWLHRKSAQLTKVLTSGFLLSVNLESESESSEVLSLGSGSDDVSSIVRYR